MTNNSISNNVRERIITALRKVIDMQHLLIEEPSPPEHVEHFLGDAKLDLERAENSLKEKDCKWAIVQGYYSMFDAARAVLFKLGLRDKKHYVIALVLEELSKLGKLEEKYVDDFKASMRSREDANYRRIYSTETASFILETAKEFLNRMKKLVRNL